ncbi:LysR family transcriptional regulator [Blautia sp. RD014234]|nr:LysR family transcriptional regulator [Blautia parvula]
MNTKDLKCFEAVYQEKSISRAARRLYITPQGLGKNIRTLEAELETVLLSAPNRVCAQHRARIFSTEGRRRSYRSWRSWKTA